jgi:hypothetical protein
LAGIATNSAQFVSGGGAAWNVIRFRPDGIYEVAYGGLTDGEPMMFVWGRSGDHRGGVL